MRVRNERGGRVRTAIFITAIAIAIAATALGLSGCDSSHKAVGDASAAASVASTSDRAGSSATTSEASPTTSSAVSSATASTSGNGREANTAQAQCSLVTAAAVTSAFGGRVSTIAGAASSAGGSVCTFSVASSNAGADLRIFVSTHQPVTLKNFQATKASAVKAGSVPVAGVGDDAYYSPAGSNLQLISGTTAAAVQAVAQPGRPATAGRLREDVTALARSVLSGL